VLEERLRVKRLVEEIVQLPDRQREALVAHELEGRSYEEIAHRMSATTPIVRQLVHRARTRLRDACGVLVPVWALRWLAVADIRAAGPERVGETIAGGAGGAGLLKAGTALLGTGAIATGTGGLVIESNRQSPHHGPAAAGARSHAAARPDRQRSAQPRRAGAHRIRRDDDRDDSAGARPHGSHEDMGGHDGPASRVRTTLTRRPTTNRATILAIEAPIRPATGPVTPQAPPAGSDSREGSNPSDSPSAGSTEP
jgi:Sigma-70, region 4